MSDSYAPVRGKCTFWREARSLDDQYDTRIKDDDKRVDCSCFIEGDGWTFRRADVPEDCPNSRRCRYYIKCY